MIPERSPKTAAQFFHFERIVPMTTERRPFLPALLDQAPAGGDKVVPRFLSNMRAGCATNWARALPAHLFA